MKRYVAAAIAVGLGLAVSHGSLVGAASLRHLEYTVTLGIAGKATKHLIRADIVDSRDGGATVELREDDGPQIVAADIDKVGSITLASSADARLSRAQVAMLVFLALEAENMTGVDKGDAWSRDSIMPGGRQSTQYVVSKNDKGGHIELQVKQDVEMLDGEAANWRGRIAYDAYATVPTSIELVGRVMERDQTDALRPHAVALTLTLSKDSFQTKR